MGKYTPTRIEERAFTTDKKDEHRWEKSLLSVVNLQIDSSPHLMYTLFMDIDLELYRREVRISSKPLVRLSAIDISPDMPRRTLVFLHGFGGQASQWHNQLQKFSLENRVIALDLRGHGMSDKPPGSYDMPQIQADFSAALDVLGVNEPFVLVGHSFGGAVAVEFTLSHPERVERLALMATAGEFKLNPMLRTALKLPLSLLKVVSPFTKSWLQAPLLPPLHFVTCRGRDTGCPAPPSQIPACSIPAPGSSDQLALACVRPNSPRSGDSTSR